MMGEISLGKQSLQILVAQLNCGSVSSTSLFYFRMAVAMMVGESPEGQR